LKPRYNKVVDNHSPATKADLTAVEQRLDAKIDAVEQRLDAKIDAVGQRLDTKIDAVEKRLDTKIDAVDKQVRDTEERLSEKLRDTEERLSEQMRDMQTELLKAFLPWQEQIRTQCREHEAHTEISITAIRSRVEILERRLFEIEKRLLMNPPAA